MSHSEIYIYLDSSTNECFFSVHLFDDRAHKPPSTTSLSLRLVVLTWRPAGGFGLIF